MYCTRAPWLGRANACWSIRYGFDSILHLATTSFQVNTYNPERTSSKFINTTGNSEYGISEWKNLLVTSLQPLDLEDLQLPAGYCILIGDTRDSPRRAAAADMHAVLHTVEAASQVARLSLTDFLLNNRMRSSSDQLVYRSTTFVVSNNCYDFRTQAQT